MFQTSRLAAVVVALQATAVLAPTATLAQAVTPAGCPQGMVWREAYPDDYLCVTPQVRAKARAHTCPPSQMPQADGTCVPAPATAIAPASPPVPTTRSNVSQVPFLGVTGPRPFLIIAPDEFLTALEPLVAHKNSTGVPTLAVSGGKSHNIEPVTCRQRPIRNGPFAEADDARSDACSDRSYQSSKIWRRRYDKAQSAALHLRRRGLGLCWSGMGRCRLGDIGRQ